MSTRILFWSYVLRFFGVCNILFALIGIAFNVYSFFQSSEPPLDNKTSTAYFVMSYICIAFYILLAIAGVQLIRLRYIWAYYTPIIFAAEILYFMVIVGLWGHPTWGDSIGGATGIANGGLSIQYLTLYPIWASCVLLFTAYRLRTPE